MYAVDNTDDPVSISDEPDAVYVPGVDDLSVWSMPVESVLDQQQSTSYCSDNIIHDNDYQ